MPDLNSVYLVGKPLNRYSTPGGHFFTISVITQHTGLPNRENIILCQSSEPIPLQLVAADKIGISGRLIVDQSKIMVEVYTMQIMVRDAPYTATTAFSVTIKPEAQKDIEPKIRAKELLMENE